MKTKILLLGLLMVLGAVQLVAQPLVRSGWTTTSDPATARAALGVGTGGATNGIDMLNGFGTNTTFEGWTLFNSIKTNNGVVYYPLLTGSRVLSLDANKAVSSSTVTTTELGYLSGTTELLTTSIGNLRGATNGLNTRVNNLEGATNGLTTRVNGHDTSIGNLQGATNGLTTRLNGHDTSIANLQGATNGLTTRLNGHDTDIGNLQGATNGLASDISRKADTNSPTLFSPRILNGGGTSNQVWTLTNTVTGEGEWRTVSGGGGGAFPDGGTATNATLKGVTTFAQDAQIQINWVPMNPATLRTNEGMSQTAILYMNTNITVASLGTNTSPYLLLVNGSNFTVTVGGDVWPTRGGGDLTMFSVDNFGGPTSTNIKSDYLTSAQFRAGISDPTGTGGIVSSNAPTLYQPRLQTGGGTSNQVATLTNASTGEWEWRTVTGGAAASASTNNLWDIFRPNDGIGLIFADGDTTMTSFGDSATSGGGTPTASAPDVNQPQMVNWATGATAGNNAGVSGTIRWFATNSLEATFQVRTFDTNAVYHFIGFSAFNIGNTMGSTNPATSLFGIRSDGTNGGSWLLVTKDGTTQEESPTGVQRGTNTFTVAFKYLVGSQAICYIDGAAVATNTVNFPANVPLGYIAAERTVEDVAKNFRVARITVQDRR